MSHAERIVELESTLARLTEESEVFRAGCYSGMANALTTLESLIQEMERKALANPRGGYSAAAETVRLAITRVKGSCANAARLPHERTARRNLFLEEQMRRIVEVGETYRGEGQSLVPGDVVAIARKALEAS